MKALLLIVLCCVCQLSRVNASECLLEQGKALIDTGEYVRALDCFDCVMQRTDWNVPGEERKFISAAFYAAVLAKQLGNVSLASSYCNLLQDVSNELDISLKIKTQLVNSSMARLQLDSFAVNFICTECGRFYPFFRPSICGTCGNSSFYMSNIDPSGG